MRSGLVGVSIVLIASAVHAEDWPEFRGPTGQGTSRATGLPTEWSKEKNIAWTAEIPGLGWSSPVLVDGRIYLTSGVPADDARISLQAFCFDAANGAKIWEKTLFTIDEASAQIHGKNSHASPTPIVAGESLFVHFGTFGTARLSLAGDVEWMNTELKYDPRHGSGNSPVLVGDVLFVNCDGADVQFVVGLDAATGQVRWRQERAPHERQEKFSFCTPLVLEIAGRTQVVSPGSGGVVAYDPTTGEQIWAVKYDGYSVVPRPVYGHGLVYVCTGFGPKTTLLAIDPTGSGDVTESHVKWTSTRGVPQTPSLVLEGDSLYMVSDNGVATCLDAKTGEQTWTKRIGGNFSASPLLADGHIYLLSEEGETTVFDPADEFKPVAKNALAERAFASITPTEGALFLRTESKLYRIQNAQSE